MNSRDNVLAALVAAGALLIALMLLVDSLTVEWQLGPFCPPYSRDAYALVCTPG